MTPGTVRREVVIVGAGPAGATLAYQLLQRGVKPLTIDKAAFPRPKVCAGGLTVKTRPYLPPDLGPILEEEIYRVHLSFGLGQVFTKDWPQPLLHTVDRRRLDAFLVAQLKQAGGEMGEGERLQQVKLGPGEGATVVTSRRRIATRVVVGADGARSLVARQTGLKPVDFWHLGLQAAVPRRGLSPKTGDFKGTIFLDLGSLADGYAWVFPRAEAVVLGVGGPASRGRELKSYLARLMAALGLEAKDFPLEAHLVPHRIRASAVRRGPVLLVGDAAGLADYWTGEGIFTALHSASLAAPAILRELQGEAGGLGDYQWGVDREITPELTASYQFAKMFNYAGRLAYRCLKRYDYPWEVFCRVMRGDRSMAELKQRFRPDIFLRKLLVKSARGREIS